LECPVQTGYPKILRLETGRPDATREPVLAPVDVEALIDDLEPVCRLDPLRSAEYRNRDRLLDILCTAVPTLKEFRHAAEN